MPTYLNVGVTLKSYMALKELYGNLVASKIYLNNLKTIHALLFSEVPKVRKEKDKITNHKLNKIPEKTLKNLSKKIKLLYEEISAKDDEG